MLTFGSVSLLQSNDRVTTPNRNGERRTANGVTARINVARFLFSFIMSFIMAILPVCLKRWHTLYSLGIWNGEYGMESMEWRVWNGEYGMKDMERGRNMRWGMGHKAENAE